MYCILLRTQGEEDQARAHRREGIFVGYSETSKAFWIYIPTQRRVVVRRDVKFEEDRAFMRSQELEYLDKPDPRE